MSASASNPCCPTCPGCNRDPKLIPLTQAALDYMLTTLIADERRQAQVQAPSLAEWRDQPRWVGPVGDRRLLRQPGDKR